MTHPAMLILGYSESAMLLRQGTPVEIKGVVSVQGSHEQALECGDIPHKLVLHFDDMEPMDPDDPLARYRLWVRQKWAAQTGRTQTPPTVEDARRIIEFAGTLSATQGTVLFQCQGGVSRSAAAALISLAVWTGQGHEDYSVEQLLRARPSAAPLSGLVRFADDLLHREGRLLRAVHEARSRR